jgi:acyl-CoA hydrolase
MQTKATQSSVYFAAYKSRLVDCITKKYLERPMARDTQWHNDINTTVDQIIDTVGKDIRVGMPLGMGKPAQLVNALYERAKADTSIQLTIITALTLEKPVERDPIKKAFLTPLLERIYGDCADVQYAVDITAGKLPSNVRVKEFFFKPGSRIRNKGAQIDYISSNYTHAARDVFANGCNVAMQIVATREEANGSKMISMSCNPDTSPELVRMLDEAKSNGAKNLVIGVVNQQLPYMYKDAEISPSVYDIILDVPADYTKLFSTPKLTPITTPCYMIGLNAASLVPDGGTLQIGIGALGDAIVYALMQRHSNNASFNQLLQDTGIASKSADIISEIGGTAPFETGLYGATEMFVEGFLHLYNAGILKREVFDFWAVQTLINEGKLDPNNLTSEVFANLEELGVRVIRTKDFDMLQYHGFFNDETKYDAGYIIAPDGTRVHANVAEPETRKVLGAQCLGKALRNGTVLHGGFFMGSNDFYDDLRALPLEDNQKICMTSVEKVNQLDLNPRLYIAQRHHARFINTGIIATMSGAIASDGIESNQVVSGVGGQYNFVAMAHQLHTGRSILMIRSVREKAGDTTSNIMWNYGHCTIPRHLRDIVITEYGIAVLRSKSDSEVMKALLNVMDSRFQQEMLKRAIDAGKIEAGYTIPAEYCQNTPEQLTQSLAKVTSEGLYPVYPFGCDMLDDELQLVKVLKGLAARKDDSKLKTFFAAIKVKTIPADAQPWLERMQLTNPEGFQQKMIQKLFVLELKNKGLIN